MKFQEQSNFPESMIEDINGKKPEKTNPRLTNFYTGYPVSISHIGMASHASTWNEFLFCLLGLCLVGFLSVEDQERHFVILWYRSWVYWVR